MKEKKLTVVSDTARKVYTLFGAEVNAQKATFEILQAHGRIPKIEEAAKMDSTEMAFRKAHIPMPYPQTF